MRQGRCLRGLRFSALRRSPPPPRAPTIRGRLQRISSSFVASRRPYADMPLARLDSRRKHQFCSSEKAAMTASHHAERLGR